MIYKTLLVIAAAIITMSSAVSCSDKKKKESSILPPPVPVEATDANSITFDEGNFDFASILDDDYKAAKGSLSIEEIQGNRMLKFTDSGDSFENGLIQKIRISMLELMTPENVAKVKSIEFDFYADATEQNLKADDGTMMKVPGWIGGGGGTMLPDGKTWYDFSEFSKNEYTYEFSGACHVKFQFLLVQPENRWTAEMEDPNFLIMRWGMKNDSNIYIDNLTFYDDNGNSIPLTI